MEYWDKGKSMWRDSLLLIIYNWPPGEGKSYPLQYSGLENSMDCIVYGVTKSRTRLRDFHFHFQSSESFRWTARGVCVLSLCPTDPWRWVFLDCPLHSLMAELLCVSELNSDLNPYPTLTLILVLTALVTRQAPLSMGFSRQKYWSGFPFPSPQDLPNPGIEPRSPTLRADTLPAEPQGKSSQLHCNIKLKV